MTTRARVGTYAALGALICIGALASTPPFLGSTQPRLSSLLPRDSVAGVEGALATMVIIACGAALGMKRGADGVAMGASAFTGHYASWSAAQGLGAKLVDGPRGDGPRICFLHCPGDVRIELIQQ